MIVLRSSKRTLATASSLGLRPFTFFLIQNRVKNPFFTTEIQKKTEIHSQKTTCKPLWNMAASKFPTAFFLQNTFSGQFFSWNWIFQPFFSGGDVQGIITGLLPYPTQRVWRPVITHRKIYLHLRCKNVPSGTFYTSNREQQVSKISYDYVTMQKHISSVSNILNYHMFSSMPCECVPQS